jgi:hypothetical protein
VSSALIAILAGTGALVVAVAQNLIADEIKGWIPWLARALANRAARKLPVSLRERYDGEWRAELEPLLVDRRLSALAFSAHLWLVGSRRIARIAPGPAMPELSHAQPVVSALQDPVVALHPELTRRPFRVSASRPGGGWRWS